MALFPQYYLHKVYQGVDYLVDLTLLNPDGSVVDLSGADVVGAIATIDGVETASFLVTILDAALGRVRVEYPSSYPILAPGRYLHQLLATLPSEGIRAYYAGDVQVFRNVAIGGIPLADANAIAIGTYPIDLTNLQDQYILKFDLASETWFAVPDTGGAASYTFSPPLSEAAGVVAIAPASGLSAGSMSALDYSKLQGIETGATANATDAQLRDRATHTGTQAVSTVSGLQAALDGKESAGTAAAAIVGLTPASIGAQPVDSDLTAIAGLTTTGFIERTGTGAATARGLIETDIPNLPASRITTGTLADNVIPGSIARDSEVSSAIAAITPASIGAVSRVRQEFSDANVVISAGTTQLVQTGTLTAERTITVPLANSVSAGFTIEILDESGSPTITNKLVAARSGSDTINGLTTFDAVFAARGGCVLISNGANGWLAIVVNNQLAQLQGGAPGRYIRGSAAGWSAISSIPISDIPNLPASKITSGVLDGARLPYLSIYQPADADLDAIAALTTQPFGRSLLTQASEATTRRALFEVDAQRGSAKPTTRSDGGALVTGDRWYSTSDNLWFFWNGTYWLSETLFRATNASSSIGILPIDSSGFNLWLERWEVAGQTGATNTGTAFAQFTLERRSLTADTTVGTLNTAAVAVNTRFYVTENLNIHLDVAALSLTSLRVLLTNISGGSSPTGQVQGIRYRLAKP